MGKNPFAIYHDPDLAPSHHYFAAYRGLASHPEAGGFGADALVHLGKHGSMEWLPGKNAALLASCATGTAIATCRSGPTGGVGPCKHQGP